jgi:hypothetical protein
MPVSIGISVAVVRPGVASVSYSVPLAELDCIELSASAYTDVTGKLRYIGDIVLLLDEKRIYLSKQASDIQALSDLAAKQPTKSLSDSTSLSDSKSIEASKRLTDLASTADAAAKFTTRSVADNLAPADLPSKRPEKSLADLFGLTDSSTRSAAKGLSDTFSLTETVYAVRLFIRAFGDTPLAQDKYSSLFTKAPISDLFGVTDFSSVLPIKYFADFVGMDDGTSVGDGSTYFFQKAANNVVFVSDADTYSLSKPAFDQFAVSEAGLVVMQGYSDITYFSDDYVGVSSTF